MVTRRTFLSAVLAGISGSVVAAATQPEKRTMVPGYYFENVRDVESVDWRNVYHMQEDEKSRLWRALYDATCISGARHQTPGSGY